MRPTQGTLGPSPDVREILGERWYPLDYHAEQARFWSSPARFKVGVAGRRGGKSELAKRKGVLTSGKAPARIADFRVIFAAPTRDQVKEIYWEDLKALTPLDWLARDPLEVELRLSLVNGASMQCIGLDKPIRAEGRPIDWLCIDEIGDCKPGSWERSLSPALDTRRRPGEAMFIGKPRGRGNHLFKLWNSALSPTMPDWDGFTWESIDIIGADATAAAARRMDKLSFDQEYRAKFVSFEGLAYYGFERSVHAVERLSYDPSKPLVLCFDFNVKPGIAVVCQEQLWTERMRRPQVAEQFTAIIGEVHIPDYSTTPAVCRKLIADWKHHRGEVWCYGDPSGGARHTDAVTGSNWQIIRDYLEPAFPDRVTLDIGRKATLERVRVNALNARLRSADGTVAMLVDPVACPNVVDDFEGVALKPGTDGEILKEKDSPFTHMTDAVGYYVQREHPFGGGAAVVQQGGVFSG